MGRKKLQRQDQKLSQLITFRVTESFYQKLTDMHKNSDCASIGEVARRILAREKIVIFYKDVTLDNAMEELANIRKELNAIGVNINQVTRQFNIAGDDKQKLFFALKATDLYTLVGTKVDQLQSMVSKMAAKWLQS